MFYEQENNFRGGRNVDDDLKVLPEGDFLLAYNCHIGTTNQSHTGSVENVKGNTLVSFLLPAGTNRCIGKCVDAQRKAIVFFLYNSNGDHSIRRFFVDTNIVELIIQDPVLGFRPERRNRIHSSNIVEEKLYWVNLALFPCKINMERAIGYLNRWFFFDNFFAVGGFVGFTSTNGTGQPPPYVAGNTITIVQTVVPGYNPAYNGYATITSVSGNTIITDIPWGGSTPQTPGYIVLSSAYSIINQEVIDALKRPPNFPLSLQYTSDSAKNINGLKKLLPQVVYRYIYDDYEKSAWSPYSKLALPEGDETFDGELFGGLTLNNVLNITLNSGANIVKKIEIGVRFGNIADVFSAVILDKNELRIDDDTIYTWAFTNSRGRIGLDQADVRRPFDNLPQVARAQELLSENVLAYGGNTEGYDNVPIDIELNVIQQPIAINPEGRDTLPSTIIPSGGGLFIDEMVLTIDQFPPVNSVITLAFNMRENPTNPFIFRAFRITYTVTAADVGAYPSLTPLLLNLKTIIEGLNLLPVYPPGNPPMVGPFTVTDQPTSLTVSYPFNISTFTVDLWSVDYAAVKFTGHKRGAYHNYGIVYMDRGNRSGTVNEDKLSTPSEIYVPFPTEQTTQPNANYRDNISWQIKHQPPEFATHYSWYYTGNKNILDCTQYIIRNIAFQSTARGNVLIDLTFLNTHQQRFPGSMVPAFVYNADAKARIRFITGATNNTTNGPGPLLETYIDLEILGVDTVNQNIIIVSYFDWVNVIPTTVGINSMVEIYTPQSDIDSSDGLYFEKGEVFEIGNPHTPQRYHKGEFQNQDPNNYSGVPATGVFERGDIYHIARALNAFIFLNLPIVNITANVVAVTGDHSADVLAMGVIEIVGTPASDGIFEVASVVYDAFFDSTNITIVGTTPNSGAVGTIEAPTDNYWPQALVETFSYSDYYESRSYDKGRPNIVSADTRRKYLNIVRHSRKYLQETKVNGLNTFYDESVQFSDAFGLINKIIEVGYTLKVLQEQKNTSVYVGRTVMNKPDGTQDILGTNIILGTTVPQIENYGTMHPESVYRHDRYLYYYDFFGSRFIRDAANGPQVISDFKMKTFFRDKTNTINQIGLDNSHVFCEWDETFQKVLVTFWFTNTIFETLISETIAFHEADNRWRETYAYVPEEFGQLGQTLITFKNGLIWVHNTNNTYNNFYGQQYDQKIRFAMNEDYMKHKVMGSMAVYSTEKWFADTDYILIPPHAEYPGGMRSRILANKFAHKQGCWYAEFSRDANTPNANPVGVYINGRKMQGYVLDVMLKNDHTTFVLLDQVIIQSVPSEKSK